MKFEVDLSFLENFEMRLGHWIALGAVAYVTLGLFYTWAVRKLTQYDPESQPAIPASANTLGWPLAAAIGGLVWGCKGLEVACRRLTRPGSRRGQKPAGGQTRSHHRIVTFIDGREVTGDGGAHTAK